MFNPERLSPDSFEHYFEIGLEQQYIEQVKTLQRLGLLELLPTCEQIGIHGIDGREYPIPSLDNIKARMREQKEIYQTKFNQGFTRIQFTPFGLPLEMLFAKLKEQLLKHHKEGKLFATKESPTDPDEPLALDTTKPPLSIPWGWIDKTKPMGEQGADVSGECVYHVKKLESANHQGKTKQQILDEQREHHDPFAGWEVKLIEPSANSPSEGNGKIFPSSARGGTGGDGGRKQVGAYQPADTYLTLLQTDPQYKHEHGKTNEDWITQFLIHLEQTNQVIDNAFLSGSYLPALISCGGHYWRPDDAPASSYACSSAVGI